MSFASVELTVAEQLTPFLPLVGTMAGGLVVGAFALWNRKRGAVENGAPDANEIWARAEKREEALDYERSNRRHFEDLAFILWRAFRSYSHRVRHGGTVDLTPSEQKLHDTRPAELGGTSQT